MTDKPRKSATNPTRKRLILAGEELFGSQGIDAVSLRQINVAAGQKNSSAAHYHFGSKEKLILAIYEYRMGRVNTRRMEMLDAIEEAGNDGDVRNLVEAIVYPIAEEIDESEGGANYINFMAHAMGHANTDLIYIWGGPGSDGLKRVYTLIRAAVPDVPDPLFGHRFGLSLEQTIHGLADRQTLRSGEPAEFNTQLDSALYVSNLVDTIAGGISAPVSEVTKAEFVRLGKSKKKAT